MMLFILPGERPLVSCAMLCCAVLCCAVRSRRQESDQEAVRWLRSRPIERWLYNGSRCCAACINALTFAMVARRDAQHRHSARRQRASIIAESPMFISAARVVERANTCSQAGSENTPKKKFHSASSVFICFENKQGKKTALSYLFS